MPNFQFSIFNLKLKVPVGWAVPTLILSLMIIGCTKKTEPAIPQTDSTDTEKTQMRIISLAPNLTEMLFALGMGQDIVGVTKQCTWPLEAKEKACVGGFWQPDIEAMLALRPTLLVNLWFDQQAAVVSRMERAGCEVLTLRIETIDQLYEAIKKIGQAVGKDSDAETIVQRLKGELAEITARYVERPKPKVLWVVGREPFCVAGTNTFINDLITIAGGVNAMGPTLNQYPRISNEQILLSAPDVIIEPVMNPDQADTQHTTAETFYKRFESIPAVQNNRIYVIDGDIVSRLGPRLDQAARRVAECLWQE
jgi:iron complex transport system substrate-binding protein